MRRASLLGFSVCSVIFLWSWQFMTPFASVPIYFITSVLVAFSSPLGLKSILFGVFVCCSLFVSVIVQIATGVDFDTQIRMWGSMVALAIISAFVLDHLKKCEAFDGYQTLYKQMNFFLIFNVLYQLFQVFFSYFGDGIGRAGSAYFFGIPRYSGFFNEPSHLAVSLAPILFLWAIHGGYRKSVLTRYGKAALVLSLLLAPSATLLAVVTMVLAVKLLYSLSANKLLKYGALSIALIPSVVVIVINVPPLHDRIESVYMGFVGVLPATEMKSLSALVFLRGINDLVHGLGVFPLGIGFQNYQMISGISGYGEEVSWFEGNNKYSGASVLFKTVGEFGWVGAALIIYAIGIFFRNIRVASPFARIENAFLFGLICSFFRGTGYFSGVPLIALTLVLYRVFSGITKTRSE